MASQVLLLPSMNRNLLRPLDVNESGEVAYCWRCSIYVFNFRTSIPVILDSKIIPNAHRGRALSVSFCKSSKGLIASIGDDNFVRIWDLEADTETCIASIEAKEGTRVVEWLHGSASCVTFPSLHGYLNKWNYMKNNLTQMKTGSESFINLLSSNKLSPELLAVGHVVGSISILNVNTRVLMYKLKSHVLELTSISWSPVSSSMLLSTSIDQTARVWKLGEFKPVRTFSYPRLRKMEDKKYPVKLCGMFHPNNPDVIICSNVRGSLGEVTFKENEVPKFASYDEQNSDTGFKSVSVMIPYLTEENKTLLLTADHLKISLWDISERKLLSSFGYLNGNIYDLAPSIMHPHLLAISSGDGCLRVWNANDTSQLNMTTVVLYNRIKIMTIAWHPTEEGIIAYGSDEGRVGIVDVQRKRCLYSYETHLNNSIYSLQWAPCLKIKDSEDDFFLYACGGGSIYIYELHQPKEKPADFDDLITFPPDMEFVQRTHSELSWKFDYSCLIIGSYKGFLDIFDNKLNFLTRVTMQMKVIESIKWHPRFTFTTSSKGSDYSSWFAATGTDDNIQVFDTSDMKNGDSDSNLFRPIRSLIGHKKKISSLCWNPHIDGYLASASRDGTVLVWNVIANTIVANYSMHKDIVYAVNWSFLDPDTICSGGLDCCLRVWKISEQTHSQAPDKSQVIKRKTKVIKFHNDKPYRKEFQPAEEVSFCEELCASKSSNSESPKVFNVSKTEESLPKEVYKNSSKMPKEMKEVKRRLFFGYMTRSNEKKLENVLKLTDLLSQPVDSSDSENMSMIADKVTENELLYCGLYCDQLTTVKMLEAKAEAEKKHDNMEKVAYFQMMSNNVEPLLLYAAENQKITDFLMTAAVTVSREFYNEMCKKYALQLIEEKNYIKASMYLLFCGELHSAVKLLLEQGRVLEGLALAKARLPADDPFILGALHKASSYFALYHCYENEAECYLALKEPSQAAKTLYRRDDSSSIYASTYICKKFNLIEEAESYGYCCMEKCLSEAAWPIFYKLVDLLDSLKVYKLLVRVHELIFTEIKNLKKDGILASKLYGVTGSKPPIWESKAFGESKISFLPFVYDVLKSENIIPEDKESLVEIRKALESMIAKRQKYETSEEIHIKLAIYTSQIIVATLLNDDSIVEKYFLKLFSAACNVFFLPRVVFWIFLPFDIYWNSNKDAFIFENKYLESPSLSFLHLQCIFKSICDKFESFNTSAPEDFSISEAFSSNLNEATEQVLRVLLKKMPEDSLMLYFSIFYITELRKLAKNGWRFRCYNNVTFCDKKTEIVPEDVTVSDIKNCNKDTTNNDIKNSKEYEVESKTNCSSQENDNVSFNNHPPPLMEENDFTLSNSLKTVQDNVKNLEYANTLLSSMSTKIKDFLIPLHHDDDDDTITENGFFENVNCKIKNEMSSTKKNESEISLTEKIEYLSGKENGESEKKFESEILSSEKIEEILSGKENGKSEILSGKENGESEILSTEKIENEILSGKKNDEIEISSTEKIEDEVLSGKKNGEREISSTEKSDNEVLSRKKNGEREISSTEKSDNEVLSGKENGEHEISSTEKIDNKVLSGKENGEHDISSAEKIDNKVLSGKENGISEISSTGKIEVKVLSAMENSEMDEQKIILNNTDNKSVENRKLSSLENINKTIEVEETSSETDNDHLQCWSDVSLYYTLTKCFTYINCRDEYALFFYLHKYLHYMDCAIGKIARQQSAKSVLSNPKELSHIIKDNSIISHSSESLGSPALHKENGCFMLEKEIKDEVDENQVKSHSTVNSGEKIELTNETNVKVHNQESEENTNSDLPEKVDLSQGRMVSESLHSEHERVSDLVKLLNSVEFDYPNPFDAVTAINAICCEIVHKNPCNFVKKKFHEFAHEVNKWNAKFCIRDETVKCEICSKTICV